MGTSTMTLSNKAIFDVAFLGSAWRERNGIAFQAGHVGSGVLTELAVLADLLAGVTESRIV
jgi:hypothetical protein